MHCGVQCKIQENYTDIWHEGTVQYGVISLSGDVPIPFSRGSSLHLGNSLSSFAQDSEDKIIFSPEK